MDINLQQITDEMFELKDTEARLKFELNQVKKRIERQEIKFMSVLQEAKTDEMEFSGCTFGYKTTQRQALDQKLLKEKYPEQFKDCYILQEKQDFYFHIN